MRTGVVTDYRNRPLHLLVLNGLLAICAWSITGTQGMFLRDCKASAQSMVQIHVIRRYRPWSTVQALGIIACIDHCTSAVFDGILRRILLMRVAEGVAVSLLLQGPSYCQ
ncbi:hypothetical protein A0H81_09483 [Grifola frondosa]|uniref:Uncharacterized protein n=1 Tax=Grifola frondosa TaxID=5627 RepID=A0A1C7M3E0_GRIFR|nr:hypothetical protein A0H81_09483 [Grifola frondosa]